MQQDNYGGNNYQTQTGQNNKNYFGGQHYHYYLQEVKVSLEESFLKNYYQKAGELISESYIRNDQAIIDERCNQNLNRLQITSQLLPEKTYEINEEILKLYDSYSKPFKAHIEELKLLLQKYGALSIQVSEWLEDCPKFLGDQQFIGTACSLVGYQLYVEDMTETASDFISRFINFYPDSSLAYLTQGLIYCKKGDFKRTIKTISAARHFYEMQPNRIEEYRHFKELEEELEKIIYQFNKKERFWNRLYQNITYVIATIARFLLLG